MRVLKEIGRFAEGSECPLVGVVVSIDCAESTVLVLGEVAFFFAVGTSKLGEPCRMHFGREEFNV